VVLWCGDYNIAPSDGGDVVGRFLGNPHCHRLQVMESGVPLAEVQIGLDCHVGMLLRCGVGGEFLLCDKLRGFEYHDCFCCKM